MNLPRSRDTNIVVQEIETETLVYDLDIDKAFCLNQTSAIVFQACGSKQTFADLKSKHKFTDEIIYLTLDELKKNNLLKDDYESPFADISRREVIRKVGLASMIALPVISGLIAPLAAQAQSVSCTTTTSQGQGTCPSGQRCVDGSCSACIASRAPLPGGCSGTTVRRCCTGGCAVAAGTCN